MTQYSVVLPCYNEAENLPSLVDRFGYFSKDWDFELILVDNGSTDNSQSVLNKLVNDQSNRFIKPHRIKENKGYGYGIKSGLNTATGDMLAFTHADSQTPPEDVFRAFDLFRSGKLDAKKDIVKGIRQGRNQQFKTTKWLSFINRIFTGIKVEDINGQPKVFHKSLLHDMILQVNNFGFDPYVLFVASERGLSINTIEVNFEDRKYGESKSAATMLKKVRTIGGFIYSIIKFSTRTRFFCS